MDRRSRMWRKRSSSDKSPGETESSGSISSHSERYFDEQQEHPKASPVDNTQSPEVTSKSATSVEEVNDNMRNLTEKLSAALLNISAKEDLVKQHARVAEEAVSGWEKAENEAAAFKQQLETAVQKNSVLEDRVDHLDGALKECVRQLRKAREEQEQKIHEAVVQRTHEWEFTKSELESQLGELRTKLEAAKAEPEISSTDLDLDLYPKLEAAEKENSTLKLELFAQAKELEIMTLERDLSVQSAETASKQRLESIKKVAKLEAECRRLRAAARKANNNDQKPFTIASSSSIYVESFTDSQSDSGDRLLAIENDLPHKLNTINSNSVELNESEPGCSDSWASALITEFDQFKKSEKIAGGRALVSASSADISFMDDFLEMERLAALPETEGVTESAVTSHQQHIDEKRKDHDQSKADLDAMIQRTGELEEKLERMEVEKAELWKALAESQDRLETSEDQLRKTEKLLELQKKMGLEAVAKQATELGIESANTKRKAMESQILVMEAEVTTLRAKVESLEMDVEDERAMSAEIMSKCESLEEELSKRRLETERKRATNSNGELKIKQDKELAVAAGKLAECQKTIASLGQQLKSLATLEDFMIDSEEKLLDINAGGSIPTPKKSGGEYWKLHLNDAYFPKTEAVNLSTANQATDDGSGLSRNTNGNSGESLASSSSSSSASSTSVNHVGSSEKSRNGFSKLFSKSKSGICRENTP